MTNEDTRSERSATVGRGAGRARSPLMALPVLAVIAVVGAACSSAAPVKAPNTNSPAITATTIATGNSSATTSASSPSSTPTVEVTSGGSGNVLRTPAGLALYTDEADKNGIGSCTGSCAEVWPPLTVPAGTTPTGGSGFSGTLAAMKQPNGTYQVTYNGAPLYTYASDSSGSVNGNGVGGFTVVTVTSSSPPTTSASSGGSGY